MKMQITGHLDEFYNYTLFLRGVFYFVFLEEIWDLYIEVFHLKVIRLRGIESKLKKPICSYLCPSLVCSESWELILLDETQHAEKLKFYHIIFFHYVNLVI